MYLHLGTIRAYSEHRGRMQQDLTLGLLAYAGGSCLASCCVSSLTPAPQIAIRALLGHWMQARSAVLGCTQSVKLYASLTCVLGSALSYQHAQLPITERCLRKGEKPKHPVISWRWGQAGRRWPSGCLLSRLAPVGAVHAGHLQLDGA